MKFADETHSFAGGHRTMRLVLIALVALTASAGSSLGQQKSPPGSIITAPDKASDDDAVESCVEVEIDGAKALDCINRRLKGNVDRVNPVPNIPPIDARSQDIHLGIVNGPAVQQQYGPNFGQSVVPYRPTSVFKPPLGGR
jgi:hypothetical protein